MNYQDERSLEGEHNIRPPDVVLDLLGGFNEGMEDMKTQSERTDSRRKPRFPRLVHKRRLREIEEQLMGCEEGLHLI